MDTHYLHVLAHEFCADDGSFILQLRIDLHWDKDAFHRLTEAMRQCCREHQHPLESPTDRPAEPVEEAEFVAEDFLTQQTTTLPRWLTWGFWYFSTFIRAHTSHPAWKQTIEQEPEYFAKAYRRLDALAFWFFSGRLPWLDEEKGWASTFV